MKHQDGYFEGARGKQIFYQSWEPDIKPKAILLTVHGVAEHSGRYTNVVDFFTPRGVSVYALDHIGHGKSEGPRVFIDQFEDYTTTLNTFFNIIKDSNQKTPIFLLGHSMGALIAEVYLLDNQDEFEGAILSGTMAKIPEYVSAATITLGKIFSKLLPKVGLIGLDANEVCSDPAVCEAYENDPLVYRGKTTARLGAEMLRGLQRITAEAATISLPITIVHGAEDKIVDPDSAQVFYDSISSTDKTIKFYDGCFHEVFNEPSRDAVFSDLHAWLERQIS